MNINNSRSQKEYSKDGQQNIALRVHRNNGRVLLDESSTRKGNFQILLRFRVDAVDTALKQHLKSVGKNA